MKRKLIGLIALTASLSMCAMLGACDGGDDGDSSGGEHAWATDWSKDATGHWHGCEDDGCAEKGSFAAHTPSEDDGDCTTPITCSVCGYETTAGVATHTPGTEQSSDATGHWYACTVDGCEEKVGFAAHRLDDCTVGGECEVCHFESVSVAAHAHTAPTTITANADITCDRCNVVVAKALADVKVYSQAENDVATNTLPAALAGVTPTEVWMDGEAVWGGNGIDASYNDVTESALVTVETEGLTYYYTAKVCTNIITSADEFFTMSEDLAGTYVLGKDIDFSAGDVNPYNEESSWKTIGWNTTAGGDARTYDEFTGTFDGNGYALKNLTVNGHNGFQGVSACLFGNVTGGTIKNVMAELTLGKDMRPNSTKFSGLVGVARNAEIENCIVIFHTNQTSYKDNELTVGAVVGSVEQGTGIRNCVGILDASEGIVGGQKGAFGTICGVWLDNSVGTVSDCYGIYLGASGDAWTPAISARDDELTITDSAAYKGYDAFLSAVTSLSENDGWNEYWSLQNGVLKFGDETVISAS